MHISWDSQQTKPFVEQTWVWIWKENTINWNLKCHAKLTNNMLSKRTRDIGTRYYTQSEMKYEWNETYFDDILQNEEKVYKEWCIPFISV